MNKILTKVTALCVGLAMVAGVGVAVGSKKASEAKAASATETFSHTAISGMATAAAESTSGTYSVFTITVDGISSSGFNASESVRVYKNASITIAVSTGNITSATLTCTANGTTKYGPGCLTGDGWVAGTAKDGTWTGSAASFTLTASSNQARISDFSITYEAGGEVTTYTITYDANGGTGTMEDTTNTVADCTFTAPSGKVFSTWNTAANGSGTDVAPGTKVTEDTDLFAIWVDKPQCVTLDKIGTDAVGAYSETLSTVDIVDGTDTYTLNYVNGKKQNDAMILQKSSGAFISNHTAAPGDITSVVLYINSGASGSATYDVAFGTAEYTTATSGVGAVNITGGNNHEYTNSSVTGARYFCVTLGAAYNGQVLKIVVNYEASDPSKDTLNILLNDSTPSPATVRYSSGGLYYANDKDGNDVNAEWSSSNTSIFTVGKNGNNVCYVTPVAPGTANIIAKADGYNDGIFVLTIDAGAVETVTVSGEMTKTSYYVGEVWSPAGLTVTADYEYGYHGDVTSSAFWEYSPESPATNVTSVVATATFGEKSGSSSAQTVTVSRVNGIQALYSKSKGDSSGEFYGYYVGFATGSGPIVMDGEYGMMLYNSSQDVSAWTEGETILYVKSGTIDVYSGLYEVKSYTVEVVTSADIEKPIVHTTTGSESATDANRSTTATGVVATAPTKGSFTGDPGASDIQFTYTVGSNTFTVYYKKAAQTSEVMAALNDSLTNGTELTLKGFTSWYNNFQVTMIGLVEEAEGYTAADFAQDLLDQTNAVCTGYEEGDNNHDALVTIWSDLASADKYPSLPSDQKEILAEADRNESGTVVEQAMARYDFLTGKYSLSNFINGRTPIVPAGSYVPSYESNLSSSSSIAIIVIVAVASMTLLGVTLVIRKRKMN